MVNVFANMLQMNNPKEKSGQRFCYQQNKKLTCLNLENGFLYLNHFSCHLPSPYHKAFVISSHKQICGTQALLLQPCPCILNRPRTESKYKTLPCTKVCKSLVASVSFCPAGSYKTTKDLLCNKYNILKVNLFITVKVLPKKGI